MKDLKRTISIIIIGLLAGFSVHAQSESFDKGKAAFNEGKYMEALTLLNQAVHNDIYFMKGKDIPMAYAYMATIRNLHLSKTLRNGNVETFKSNPGMLNSVIGDVTNALKYQDNGSKAMVKKAYEHMIENAMIIGNIVFNSLKELDFENQLEESRALASVLNFELKNLSGIDKDNWELHDMLGISYYILGEKELSMLEFKRGREIFNQQSEPIASDLHLYNCIYSTKYEYSVTKNYAEAYQSSVDGRKFLKQVMQELNPDSVKQLRKFAKMDGVFTTIQDNVENMNIISSTKE